jgi:hypothetical protein
MIIKNGDDVLQELWRHNYFHEYGVSQLKEGYHQEDIILSFISLTSY